MNFIAPVRDQRMVLDEVVRIAELAALERFADATADTVDAVLEGAAQFAQGEFAPLDRIGDTVGSSWTDGVVTTPPGFREAYAAFVTGGWMSLAAPVEAGGQGLPLALSAALMEDLNAANIGFALCPMLSMGGIEALEAHGSAEQRADYLPKIVSGEWAATMNLTEPQAGSDVGALKTRAEQGADGLWKITGTKIFITYGEHDLSENIIHLVLARTPGSPEGTRGISLFLVPKVLPDGSRNDLHCASIEHKLGIHASPTCVMSFGDDGGATGWLIGAEREGMKAMFTMMNNARLNVALQGVGIGERATQRAVSYALERRQLGRAIADHPDVRRMLFRMRALTNGARALTYLAFGDLDRKAAGDAAAGSRAAVLIPLAKAWATDIGCEVASLGVQVHGGMGYIEETGAAQHLRDARIAPIYEGTNGIQAADLVGRKLGLDGGTAFDALVSDIRAEIAAPQLIQLADAVEVTAATLRQSQGQDRLAGSTPFLTMCAVLVAGWLLERIAQSPAAQGRDRAVSEYFSAAIVSEAIGLAGAAGNGAATLYAVPAESLA